jgi:hypothetical protein
MPRLAIFLLAAGAALAAGDNTWTKVKELKSGTDVRVLKHGSLQPVLGKFDEADDDRLMLVVKNEQIAIPKDQIDRLDYRPPPPRATRETKTTVDEGPPKQPKMGMNGMDTGSTTSTTTSVGIQGKGSFETLYRRPSPAPKK